MTYSRELITSLVINMFAITRSTDYAARVVLHLASLENEGQDSIAAIAADRFLPVPFVRRIVSRLAKAGILRTSRGVGGGVALARPAEEINLHDVIEAMEGPSCPSPCLESDRNCPLSKSCPVRNVWSQTASLLDNHLRSVRFSDLARDPSHGEAHHRLRNPAHRMPKSPHKPPERNSTWMH
jgi:Rrf2 family protein